MPERLRMSASRRASTAASWLGSYTWSDTVPMAFSAVEASFEILGVAVGARVCKYC